MEYRVVPKGKEWRLQKKVLFFWKTVAKYATFAGAGSAMMKEVFIASLQPWQM